MAASTYSPGAERKWQLVGLLGKWIIDLLFASTQIEQAGFDRVADLLPSRRFILAFWHSRILLVSHLYRGWGGVALVSASEDGEIIARVLQRQGQETIRGSTTRGGVRALAMQIRKLRERDRPAAVIPDGPQGPRFRVQPGVVTLAKKTGYPIIPITYSGRKIKVFSSWDRFILPWPFTRCRVVYGSPIWIDRNADKGMEERVRVALEETLTAITRQADLRFGHRID